MRRRDGAEDEDGGSCEVGALVPLFSGAGKGLPAPSKVNEECCAEQRLRDVREQALLVMKWGCGEVGDGRTEQSAAGKEREDSSQKNACGGQRALY